jgi:hypothetical protein
MDLTAIVTYRQRPHHLDMLLAWWTRRASAALRRCCQVVVVEADEQPTPGLAKRLAALGMDYQFFENTGVFHKTRALNLGLQWSRGQFVTPWDVDLIPVGQSLNAHLQLAKQSPNLLVSGYRLMAATETLDVDRVETVAKTAAIACEDSPSALRKHLTAGERFGVLPFFAADRLLKIGGWDEGFRGWGAEDQDLLERYLSSGGYLCRCPDLLYLHLAHPRESNWTEEASIARNRQHYYLKMKQRQGRE